MVSQPDNGSTSKRSKYGFTNNMTINVYFGLLFFLLFAHMNITCTSSNGEFCCSVAPKENHLKGNILFSCQDNETDPFENLPKLPWQEYDGFNKISRSDRRNDHCLLQEHLCLQRLFSWE